MREVRLIRHDEKRSDEDIPINQLPLESARPCTRYRAVH
jgi:hypothetical protein